MKAREMMEVEKASGNVTVELRGKFLFVRPLKEIDVNVSKKMLTDIRKRIEEGQVRIIMDLSSLEFIDSTGLSVMVDLQDAATKLSGKVVFAGVGARVMRILKVTRLDRYIEQYQSVEEAERSFGEDPAAGAEIAATKTLIPTMGDQKVMIA